MNAKVKKGLWIGGGALALLLISVAVFKPKKTAAKPSTPSGDQKPDAGSATRTSDSGSENPYEGEFGTTQTYPDTATPQTSMQQVAPSINPMAPVPTVTATVTPLPAPTGKR